MLIPFVEPFHIKVVGPLKQTTCAEHQCILADAHNNLSGVAARSRYPFCVDPAS